MAWLSGLPAGLRSSHGRSAGSSLGSPRPPDAHAHVTGLGTWSHAGPSALMRPAQRCSSGSLSVPITDGSERLEGKVRGHLPSSHDHPQQASGLGGGKKRRKRKKKPKGNELEFIDLRCVSNKRTRCSVQGRGGTVPCPPQVCVPGPPLTRHGTPVAPTPTPRASRSALVSTASQTVPDLPLLPAAASLLLPLPPAPPQPLLGPRPTRWERLDLPPEPRASR